MARSSPHPLALFSLLPGNDQAKAVVSHAANAHLLSTLSDGTLVLDVGFHIRGKSSTTLAVLGRGPDADIYVGQSNIGKTQCSFELDPESGVVMLYDRSQRHSTQVFGENAMPFQHGRVRRIAVRKKLNTIIGMGGVGCNAIQFQLEWHLDLIASPQSIRYIADVVQGIVANPRLAWTADEAPTEPPSRYETRLHTPGPLQLKMRYKNVDRMGAGQFGEVYKAIDVDTGKLMAVKILKKPQDLLERLNWENNMKRYLRREIEVLSVISHPHIVNYIGAQGWLENTVEIFMGLKQGSLGSLIQTDINGSEIARTVLHHMLQALDCIANHDIIHRDVKPENILYTTNSNGEYSFQLGDFGLCNRASNAVSIAGTPIYMAPEIRRGQPQSCKADVWSLMVTILMALNSRGLRSEDFSSPESTERAISNAASDDGVSRLKEMAIFEPDKRASAAQMLVKLFDGKGLSTPRNQVRPLSTAPSIASAGLKGVASPALTAHNAGTHREARGGTTPNLKARVLLAPAGIHKRGKAIECSPAAPDVRKRLVVPTTCHIP